MLITVGCGLLGSGKTTFIRNYARGLTGKVVVLVNDFGAAGIDGEIFSAGGIESIELQSGCVCCTLKFDLITTISKIVKEFAPDHLIIEPSGVASPSAVLEAIEDAGAGAANVVCIVDAAEFTELHDAGMYGSFFEDQISSADVILVNKTDLAEEEQIIETIRRIEAANPGAILFRTRKAKISEALLRPLRDGTREDRRATPGLRHVHFHFDTLSLRLTGKKTLAGLSSFFHDIARGRYGGVVRAKALIQSEEGPYRFDVVFDKVDKVRFDRDIEDSRIVVIGEALNKPAIKRALLEGCCEELEERRVDGRDL